MYSFDEVKNADPELAKAMEQETGRQNDHIELIASVCGHRGRFGKRPRKETVWLYLCKCSATFRCPGKHGCILCFG